MKRLVLFEPEELADAYALKTLYDYLKFRRFEDRNNAELLFENSGREYSFLEECKFFGEIFPPSNSLLIKSFSDISKCNNAGCLELEIDISILKNCAMFLSYEEKLRLIWKHGIETKLPVLVISYANENKDEVKVLVKNLNEISNICLIDSSGGIGETYATLEKGILKDCYAMADASVNAANLKTDENIMHNFVEATEGGPLFMVPPIKEFRRQFGYKQLSRRKLIRTCTNFEDLLNKLTAYLDRPIKEILEETREHSGRRANYIMQTRRKYLPEIESLMEKILRKKDKISDSRLVLKQNTYSLQHPETDWSSND